MEESCWTTPHHGEREWLGITAFLESIEDEPSRANMNYVMCGVPHARAGSGVGGRWCCWWWRGVYAALCVRELEMMSFIEAQRGAETEQSE